MAEPKLRVRATGYGGSGYVNPFTGEKVIGVTTALGALEKPGIRQWAVDQTAAYAVANIDGLLSRTHEQGFGFLRWYHNRFKPESFDDPAVDVYNAHVGVLDDLAELGVLTHDWVEAYLSGRFPPDLVRPEQVGMVEAFLDWDAQHEVVAHATELTLFGNGYAGTADLFASVDGVGMLLDLKTSKAVRDEHVAQLAAYGAATLAVREVPHKIKGAVEYNGGWFVETDIPAFTDYGVLQLRPDDWGRDGSFKPAFCELHLLSHGQIDAGFELFQAAMAARYASKKLKDASAADKMAG